MRSRNDVINRDTSLLAGPEEDRHKSRAINHEGAVEIIVVATRTKGGNIGIDFSNHAGALPTCPAND